MSKILVAYRITAPSLAVKSAGSTDISSLLNIDMDDFECVKIATKWNQVEKFLEETKIVCTYLDIWKLYDDASTERIDLSHRFGREPLSKDILVKHDIWPMLENLRESCLIKDDTGRQSFKVLMRLFGIPITGNDFTDYSEFEKWFENPYIVYFKKT